ncbi:MAG: DMT family transporter [Armatimonadota bacterium]|nr:DMT family transporter [Armatimonadota bacterium]MDR5702705.1 DMT family transporter [Armatimonadota bacterium]
MEPALLSTRSRHLHSLLPAYLALAVAILCLGFSAIFVRLARAPGIVTSFYRMAVAVILMAGPFYRRFRRNGGLPRSGLQLAIIGGLFFAGDLALWATGVVMAGATNPTLLANTAPLWVGLGAMVFFREKLNATFWSGLLLALGGATLVLGLDTLRAATFGLGSLLGLLAAFFYGAYFLITQRGRETLDSLTYFWPSAVSASFALLVLSLVLRQPLVGYRTFTYLNFLAIGVVSQVLGYLAINYAIGHLPASLVSPTMLGQPVITALLAVPLLGEALTPGQILGGLAVLIGVSIVHRSRQGPA